LTSESDRKENYFGIQTKYFQFAMAVIFFTWEKGVYFNIVLGRAGL